jgi:tagaturonate epimerase
MKIYPNSSIVGMRDSSPYRFDACFLAWDESLGIRLLGVRSPDDGSRAIFSKLVKKYGEDHFYSINAENATILRSIFTWLNPKALESGDASNSSIKPSFGFGDRLGLATSGHIKALRRAVPAGSISPVFAQQSVRENSRTGRTPQEVLNDAMWGVFQEGWREPWGADADHLKQVEDIAPFIKAGYSFFTVDPGDYVDPEADNDPVDVLEAKIAAQAWGEIDHQPEDRANIVNAFLSFCEENDLACSREVIEEDVLRAQAKYGRAVIHIVGMYRALIRKKPNGFDFETSVDETDSPTSVLEHYYIASQLKSLGVRVTSLALRLPGRFEKGVDYLGDLHTLEAELKDHVNVMRHVGGYKFSLHSGSDKFSLYKMLAQHAGSDVHVKTAGTSYLEALRAAAQYDPALFRQVLELARRRYRHDRHSYHVSADESQIPASARLKDNALSALLDDFHVRQALHVTFGSALAEHGMAIKDMLLRYPEAYEKVLIKHFRRHLEPLISMESMPEQ